MPTVAELGHRIFQERKARTPGTTRTPRTPEKQTNLRAIRVRTEIGSVTVERQEDRPAGDFQRFQSCADFGGSKHFGHGPTRALALEDLRARVALHPNYIQIVEDTHA